MEYQQHGAMPGTAAPKNEATTAQPPETRAKAFHKPKRPLAQARKGFEATFLGHMQAVGPWLPLLLSLIGLVWLEVAK